MSDVDYDDAYYEDDDGDYAYDEPHGTTAAASATCVTAKNQDDDDCDEITLNVTEVLRMQSVVAQEVASLTSLSTSTASLLLRRFRWSRDVAVERYFERPAAVLEALGVSPASASREATLCDGRDAANRECGVCGMTYAADELRCLSTCRHVFCLECWQDHIKAHLQDDLLGTSCLAEGCTEVVGLQVMCELFSCRGGVAAPATGSDAATTLEQIKRQYLTSFVEGCPTLYWCPNPHSCPGVIHVPIPPLQGQGVRCSVCKSAYCMRCGCDQHRPATCKQLRDWKTYCATGGADVAFILTHTKLCPACKKPIEKNGGCNHITCRCRHEFCWICLGDWKQHLGNAYSCRNVTGEGVRDKLKEGDSASQVFMYHFERYTMHLDSRQRDERFVRVVTMVAGNDAAKSSAPADASLINVDVVTTDEVSRITNALSTARSVLAHSYVTMFYISKDGGQTQLMEHRVGKLEEATETLSESLRSLLSSSKSQLRRFLDMESVVTAWSKTLCDV